MGAIRWVESTLAHTSLAHRASEAEKSLAAVWRFAIMLVRGRGGLHLLDSNPDQELSALGPMPEDVRAIVTRTLGDAPLTVAYADELLDALNDGRPIELPVAASSFGAAPGAATSMAFGSGRLAGSDVTPAAPAPALTAAAPAPVITAQPSPISEPESPSPVFSEPPSAFERSEAATAFESRPAPSPVPPPMFDARPVPASIPPGPTVFDDPQAEEDKPEREAQAQAIEAAFDVNESDSPSRAQHLERNLDDFRPGALAASSLPRREPGGSRRPDLDHLLDQPLDALEFERSDGAARRSSVPPEAVSPSVAPTPPPMRPAAAPADDFEILVDDEILEIAEDDVEIVDDEK